MLGLNPNRSENQKDIALDKWVKKIEITCTKHSLHSAHPLAILGIREHTLFESHPPPSPLPVKHEITAYNVVILVRVPQGYTGPYIAY